MTTKGQKDRYCNGNFLGFRERENMSNKPRKNGMAAYTQATVGVTATKKKKGIDSTYGSKETPALVSIAEEAMIARNKAIENLIASETEVRRIDKEILFPALVIIRQRYKACKTPAEKK